MARPRKVGLDYFPLDVNTDSNIKMSLIEAEYGLKGFAIYIKLLQKIYGDKGYYMDWNDDVKIMLAKAFGESGSLVGEIISGLIRRGLFEKSVFDSFGVLTSASIQQTYLTAIDRRDKVNFLSDFALVDVNEYKNVINVCINPINEINNPQRKGKEKKGKERKGKENEKISPTPSPEFPFEFSDPEPNFKGLDNEFASYIQNCIHQKKSIALFDGWAKQENCYYSLVINHPVFCRKIEYIHIPKTKILDMVKDWLLVNTKKASVEWPNMADMLQHCLNFINLKSNDNAKTNKVSERNYKESQLIKEPSKEFGKW